MASNSAEIEVKFRLESFDEIEKTLVSLNARLLHTNTFQRTVRMDTPGGALEARHIFVRVRDGEKKVMTVKAKLDGDYEGYKARRELEIEISDPARAEEMLELLGFTHKMIMEKYRTEYELGDTAIALDKLPFGYFLEIEGQPEAIEQAIKKLGLEKHQRLTDSYWGLFEEYKKERGIEVENILFSN